MTFAYLFNTRKAHGCICLPAPLARLVLVFLPSCWDIGPYDHAHISF